MMKRKQGILSRVILSLFVLTLLAWPVQNVFAIDAKKPVLVVGAALDQEETEVTARTLGVKDLDSVNLETVTGEDIARFINLQGVNDSQMVSSVLVEFRSDGGVETEISTPDRITSVKDYQYSNAAITAGIYDCMIKVAAIRPVTGESALTGIYKAAEAYGVELDQDRLIAGSEELDTVQEIEKNNETNDKFDSENFSKALTEIKVEVANQVDNSSSTEVNIGDITTIITNVLNEYNINLPEADVTKLADTLVKYKDSMSEEDIQEVKKQLQEFGEKTWNMAKDVFEQAEANGVFDKIGQFFRDLFDAIASWFRS